MSADISLRPLEFNEERCLKSIAMFGYSHIEKDTPRHLLTPFMEKHGLALEELKAVYTVTLVPSGQKAAGTNWERIRLERLAKRERNAVAKKKKEQK